MGTHLLAHYTSDMIVSVLVVLTIGWFIETSASSAHLQDAVVTQNEIYVAISRFTPHNLARSYIDTVGRMNINLWYSYEIATDFAGAINRAVLMCGEIIVNVGVAVPDTLLQLYRETSGAAARIVLAGFGVALGTVFVALFSTRTSVWRLILACAISPLAISVLFLVLQGFMIAMLETFDWFTTLAPYTVACPILCTIYWIAFPTANRGATATLAHAMLRVLEPER